MIKNKMITKANLSALVLMLLMLTQSCTSIRLISDYDEITDKTVTELQEKVSNYFVKIERTIGTDDAKYEHFVQQFDDIKVDLNTLEVRAGAFEKNRIVQEHFKELNKMVNNLESLHKIGFSSYDQIKPLKQPFNSAFTAIIKLQIALKRGDKTDNNN
ncbi:hypothetical protein [Persicobacter diffluens]|uniref:Lipoprotein n=1 Tax=Persicobacter diffluens TaxID=981 RepID=A0AAN4W5L8_9BACT|nr:hypothetical protein PEDI_51370 [Persicobacter diffluens]GJM65073.1 hypothetical protein PEDI_56250 [Persicobacter diffluens]